MKWISFVIGIALMAVALSPPVDWLPVWVSGLFRALMAAGAVGRLQSAHAAIDPEEWPEVAAQLSAALESCELPQCKDSLAKREAADEPIPSA